MEKKKILALLGSSVLAALAACVPQVQQLSPATTMPSAPIIPSLTPMPSPTVAMVEVTVFFTDVNQYATGIPPFEVGVTRQVLATAKLPEAVLNAFFAGPTAKMRSP